MACSEHSTWRCGTACSVAFYPEAWHGLFSSILPGGVAWLITQPLMDHDN